MKVGQTIWIESLGVSGGIKEAKIIKIGRKFFYVNGGTRFRIDTLVHDGAGFSPSYRAHLSLDEYNNEKEYAGLLGEIKGFFRQFGKIDLTLEQLRQIKQIINEVHN